MNEAISYQRSVRNHWACVLMPDSKTGFRPPKGYGRSGRAARFGPQAGEGSLGRGCSVVDAKTGRIHRLVCMRLAGEVPKGGCGAHAWVADINSNVGATHGSGFGAKDDLCMSGAKKYLDGWQA